MLQGHGTVKTIPDRLSAQPPAHHKQCKRIITTLDGLTHQSYNTWCFYIPFPTTIVLLSSLLNAWHQGRKKRQSCSICFLVTFSEDTMWLFDVIKTVWCAYPYSAFITGVSEKIPWWIITFCRCHPPDILIQISHMRIDTNIVIFRALNLIWHINKPTWKTNYCINYFCRNAFNLNTSSMGII